MTIPKPTVYPDWALQNQVDQTSGQNNVTTPPDEKIQFGWHLSEQAPRNWFNWLGRYTGNWIRYLSQQNNQSVVVDGTGTTPSADVLNGGMFYITVIDTTVPANFYQGVTFIPAASTMPIYPIAITQIAAVSLTVGGGVSATGEVTVSGGTGPYIVWGQMKTIPS